MQLSAAVAAELFTLTEALDETDTDLAQTVRQLGAAASSAVGSYLGLTITVTTGGRPINLTALQDFVEADDTQTSLRVPLDVAKPTTSAPTTPTLMRTAAAQTRSPGQGSS